MNRYAGKTLLVLGGLSLEIEAVKYAREHGATVIVADYYEDAPAKQYANESSMISATDVEGLAKLCTEKSVDGIFTGYADILLPYYAELCAITKLPCYGSSSLFSVMTNKVLFKEACINYGVPTVKSYSKRSIDEGNITYPVLVKPTDSSGSRGISICHSFDQLNAGIEKALGYSASQSYLVESYMNGSEVVMYYYCQNGNPVFMGMCDRYVNNEQKGIAQLPTAYIFPSKYTENHLTSCDKRIKSMLEGLGMQNGPLFLQAFIEDGIPVLYEPGYRLCGAREHVIFSAIEGINSEHMLVNYALTGLMRNDDISRIADPYIHGKHACKLSPLIRPGVIASIEGLDIIRKLGHRVVALFLNNATGDKVLPEEIGTLRQVAYRAYIVSDSMSELAETIDLIQKTIVYRDKEGNSMMLGQFDTTLLQ